MTLRVMQKSDGRGCDDDFVHCVSANDAVDAALDDMEKSGQSQQIFDKWLGSNSSFKMKREFKIQPIPGYSG